MQNDNPIIALLTMLFGVLVGMMGVVSVLYFGGYVGVDRTDETIPTQRFYRTGAEALNAVSCRSGETRRIMFGGREDFYIPDNLENRSNVSEKHLSEIFAEADYTMQNYDQSVPKGVFAEQFELNGNIESGTLAFRIKQNVDGDDAQLKLGLIGSDNELVAEYSIALSEIENSDIWRSSSDLYWAALSDLRPRKSMNVDEFESENSLMGNLRQVRDTSQMIFTVQNAEMIDFVGLSTCAAPINRTGTQFRIRSSEFDTGLVKLSCDAGGNRECNFQRGNAQCDSQQPVACFRRRNRPEFETGLDETFDRLWGGGELRISNAVTGNRFQNADELHAYCASEIGPDWRALTYTKPRGDVVLLSEILEDISVWVDIPNQPHSNCWDQRADYPNSEERAQ